MWVFVSLLILSVSLSTARPATGDRLSDSSIDVLGSDDQVFGDTGLNSPKVTDSARDIEISMTSSSEDPRSKNDKFISSHTPPSEGTPVSFLLILSASTDMFFAPSICIDMP